MLTRPPDRCKRLEHARGAPHSNKPIAAISGRTENEVGASEQSEGPGDVRRLHGRDVTADEYRWTWRQAVEEALHALAEVAYPLRESLHAVT